MHDRLNPHAQRSAARARVVAFGLLYLSWGTTFFAIKEGVKWLPPALFGGVRVALAGLVLIAYLAARGQPLRLTRAELFWTGLASVFLFVGGNGLLTASEITTDSGVASVLAATAPLFLALLEAFWPGGERLAPRGWVGLLAGLAGVALLLLPRLRSPYVWRGDVGPVLVLASAFSWAVGSLIVRYQPCRPPHLASAAYQMLLGGSGLTLVGVALGEVERTRPEQFTLPAVAAFFYLLLVGSLVGFIAYTWLLRHVSAAMASTYAYVNPVVAIVVGAVLGGETVTARTLAGMAIILGSVALVRTAGARDDGTAPITPGPPPANTPPLSPP